MSKYCFFILLTMLASWAEQSHSQSANKNVPALKLSFSHPQGFYTQGFSLAIGNIPENSIVRYTTDGKEPGPGSMVYTGPIPVTDRHNEPNGISLIPTNPLDTPFQWYVWKQPVTNVNKATILRLKVFNDDQPMEEEYFLTYLVDPTISMRYSRLPVFSVITDSLNLYDYDTGIYIPGLQYELDGSWSWWGGGSENFTMRGDDWERPANLAMFEGDGALAFQQNVGIRIHGGGTRVFPQKSLRIYARSEYGEGKIHYQFFPNKDVDKFKRIILSNNGQDFLQGTMNDVIASALIEPLDIDLQASSQAVVFINGEYWGIHTIRERLDKYFLEYEYDADPDNVDIIEGDGFVEEGNTLEYNNLIDFIHAHDLQDDANFAEVETMIDIPSYIDYNICKQYLSVGDWPGNNCSCWRERVPGKKWRWFFFDSNACMLNSEANTIQLSLAAGGTQWPNPDWSTFILRNLMKNQNFRFQYLERFNYLLQTTFTPANVIHCIDSISDPLTPVFEEHIQRWSYPASMDGRNYMIRQMKLFAENRPAVVRAQLDSLLHAPDVEDISKIKVYCAEGMIILEKPDTQSGEYTLYDISGRALRSGTICNQDICRIPSPVKTGILIIRMVLDGRNYQKVIAIR